MRYSAEHPQDGAAAWLEQTTLWYFQIGASTRGAVTGYPETYPWSQGPKYCFIPEVVFKLQLDLSIQLQHPVDALLFTVNKGSL